jgi:hypothetical protein
MKVYEYIPLYGLLFNFEYQTGIDGEKMTVNEMFDNYPDFELTDIHIDQLYYFDLASLQTVLEGNYFTPETVVSYLRELFDNYRQSGGNPFDWLQGTFESINLNPQNYKAELRATLEKTLLEWIEIFNKLPIDYLYYNTNPEALPPQQTETQTFTNNFDNIKPTEIYKHFKAGLVDKGYLTEQELNEYLKAAFELKKKPETLFKLKHTPTKQNVYTVFYIYYKDISQKKHKRQKEYAALLGDFFEGYKTEIIQTNWARGYKRKS